MPITDEALHEELRGAFTRFAAATPPEPSPTGALAHGRRARRRRRLVVTGAPLASLLLIAGLVTALVPAHQRGAVGSTLVAGPTVSEAMPDLGRVGDYVATVVPNMTVKPVRFDPLTFAGGRCSEIPTSVSPTAGCWSPLQCQPNAFTGVSGPCNVGLTLTLTNNETAYRQLTVGTDDRPGRGESTSRVTVMGRPGFLVDQLDFFNDVYWRMADGRVALARGANLSAADMLAFANGLQRRPTSGSPAPAPSSPAASPSPPAVPVDAVDARPGSSPPPIRALSLPQQGSDKALSGDGWYLGITQGSGRGAASIGINDGAGHPHSSAFVYTRLYGDHGTVTPIPLNGLDAVTVADFTAAGHLHLVVSGAVARGTTGVGVLDSSGHRGWATLIDPGPAFDMLVFAYEPPNENAITGLQSFGTRAATGAQLPPYPTFFPEDPTGSEQLHRTPGTPVVVGGLTVGAVPSNVTIGADPCSAQNATPTEACWGGKITALASGTQALARFGTNSLLLDVTVAPGAEHALAYATATTTTTIRGTVLTADDEGPAVLLSFQLPSGQGVFIRGINLPAAGVLAVANSLIP